MMGQRITEPVLAIAALFKWRGLGYDDTRSASNTMGDRIYDG